MNQTLSKILVAATMLLGMSACGGGGGGSAPSPPPPTQQKTATLAFSTISSAHTAPLQGIQLTVKLPAGVTIPNLATALTTPAENSIIPGTYSAANQTASFSVLPIDLANNPDAFIKFGQFARLQCDVIPGTTLDQNSFVALNTPFDLQMFGFVQGTSVDLVPQIPVQLSVTFGF